MQYMGYTKMAKVLNANLSFTIKIGAYLPPGEQLLQVIPDSVFQGKY
jgi:hypothetical protein